MLSKQTAQSLPHNQILAGDFRQLLQLRGGETRLLRVLHRILTVCSGSVSTLVGGGVPEQAEVDHQHYRHAGAWQKESEKHGEQHCFRRRTQRKSKCAVLQQYFYERKGRRRFGVERRGSHHFSHGNKAFRVKREIYIRRGFEVQLATRTRLDEQETTD